MHTIEQNEEKVSTVQIISMRNIRPPPLTGTKPD